MLYQEISTITAPRPLLIRALREARDAGLTTIRLTASNAAMAAEIDTIRLVVDGIAPVDFIAEPIEIIETPEPVAPVEVVAPVESTEPTRPLVAHSFREMVTNRHRCPRRGFTVKRPVEPITPNPWIEATLAFLDCYPPVQLAA